MSQSKAIAAAATTAPVSTPVTAVSSSSTSADAKTAAAASLKMDLNGTDLLHVSKAMLGIQEKLVSIIRAQGTHGIIRSDHFPLFLVDFELIFFASFSPLVPSCPSASPMCTASVWS
jgi:hypothetical protein